ncbi:hypothetical protein B0T22DRAFT_454012 [Podospora appendiculata]|uniref:Uncharacterized protein n=1 Tax=Podospora appendiculata TaxID=314037 RepID=A0AAE1CHX2_9PEZI|nr:hypothetical protein B0T22DRAFT_454012 [Podospora appendiculata]
MMAFLLFCLSVCLSLPVGFFLFSPTFLVCLFVCLAVFVPWGFFWGVVNASQSATVAGRSVRYEVVKSRGV